MRLFLNVANGVIIEIVAGYNVLHDWQAWVLILWFVLAMGLIEEQVKVELRNKMLPTLDRISDRLNSWKR